MKDLFADFVPGKTIRDHLTIAQMKKLGGSFVKALAAAAEAADADNFAKIKATWPEYWAKYEAFVKPCGACLVFHTEEIGCRCAVCEVRLHPQFIRCRIVAKPGGEELQAWCPNCDDGTPPV